MNTYSQNCVRRVFVSTKTRDREIHQTFEPVINSFCCCFVLSLLYNICAEGEAGIAVCSFEVGCGEK
jgi:hypothetical protein